MEPFGVTFPATRNGPEPLPSCSGVEKWKALPVQVKSFMGETSIVPRVTKYHAPSPDDGKCSTEENGRSIKYTECGGNEASSDSIRPLKVGGLGLTPSTV